MDKKSEFYTLKGYQIKDSKELTEAMEDYLEMIYRIYLENKRIRINELAKVLNVKPSSVSKMIHRLKEHHLVDFEKYGDVTLTKSGIEKGAYLLWRHNILVRFFKVLNQENYSLEQVEKIEHFIDPLTLQNMESLLRNQK